MQSTNELVLEVVLSTDSVEPAYYLTPEDLTYQATCPVPSSYPQSSGNRISASVEFRPRSNFLSNPTDSRFLTASLPSSLLSAPHTF